MRWKLLKDVSLEPHCSGKVVVVGHTPQEGVEALDTDFSTPSATGA